MKDKLRAKFIAIWENRLERWTLEQWQLFARIHIENLKRGYKDD
jgi:hypothetical protein